MTDQVQEICLFWGGWQVQQWWSCMPKNEWSGWVQAIGAIVSIQIAIWISGESARREKRHAIQQARIIAKGCVQSVQGMSYGVGAGLPGMLKNAAIALKEFAILSQSARPELMTDKAMEAFISLKLNIVIILNFYEVYSNECSDEDKKEFIKLLEYYGGMVGRDSENLHLRHGFVFAEKYSAKEEADKIINGADAVLKKYKKNAS